MIADWLTILWIVLVINAAMFFVESAAGFQAHSTSLLADALDMLGDSLVYGFSLFVLARSMRWQAVAAVLKGSFMLAFGLGVLGEAGYKVFNPIMPGIEMMGIVGALALFANLVCFVLLYRHRSDNLNMSSTWLCSRNDLIANAGVLLAAGTSYQFSSRWPDIIVGTLIAGLFLHSAFGVLRQSAESCASLASLSGRLFFFSFSRDRSQQSLGVCRTFRFDTIFIPHWCYLSA